MKSFLHLAQKTHVESLLLLKQRAHEQDWPHKLCSAIEYCLEGGKSARTAISLWTYSQLSGSQSFPEDLRQAAFALECVHAYSLAHDDLPCMDDDDFRRSKPSLHRAYSESNAVLVGDALLGLAFELSSELESSAFLLKGLAKAVGPRGMLGGQWIDVNVDLNSVNSDLSLPQANKLHDMKTGALFGHAVAMGAGLASHQNFHKTEFYTWGQLLGRLFQYVDDRLDQDDLYVVLGRQGLDSEINKLKEQLVISGQELGFSKKPLESLLAYWVDRIV